MERTFETQDSTVTLDLRVPFGEISIDPSNENGVSVDLEADDEETQALIERTRVEQHGDRILVDVPSKNRGLGGIASFFSGRGNLICRVRCPRGTNAEVRSKSADLEAYGTLGNVDVSTASGEVELRDVDGGLNVKTASGDVRAGRVERNADIHTASGDIDLEWVGGTVRINAVSGDVRVGEAGGDTNVTTVSGDQEHEAVFNGGVTAQSVSGDVTVAVRRGARVYLDCNTLSGDTSSDLDMSGEPTSERPTIEIRVKTVSGDIRITRAPAPADSAQEVHA
jgi:hypothetical protein